MAHWHARRKELVVGRHRVAEVAVVRDNMEEPSILTGQLLANTCLGSAAECVREDTRPHLRRLRAYDGEVGLAGITSNQSQKRKCDHRLIDCL